MEAIEVDESFIDHLWCQLAEEQTYKRNQLNYVTRVFKETFKRIRS
jgi:hypothetical protein